MPRGTKVPAEIAAVCETNVDVALIEKHWDDLVHLAASVEAGHASAVAALARFGSAAQGDPIYEAGVQLGRLLRTAFWLTTLSRTLQERVAPGAQSGARLLTPSSAPFIPAGSARRRPNVSMKCEAVADALSPMANIVMAWEYLTNTGGPGSLVEPPGHSHRN